MSGQRSLFAEDAAAGWPADVHVLRQRTSLAALEGQIAAICARAPFRHLTVPGGGVMSVALTNAGRAGWDSDSRGYRYAAVDPQSGKPWPALPPAWRTLASTAAAAAGYPRFEPDCCLINRYAIGARMGAHQDRNERDFEQPIVSVSLGLPATFVWYGDRRGGRGWPVVLEDGDVLVWGRSARLGYHAVRPVAAGAGPWPCRYNLTFRCAL